MGCDIHALIERRTNPWGDYVEWLDSGDPDIGRDYEMFGVLAGVRNYAEAPPVAEPRGLPAFKGWGEYSDGERYIRWDHESDEEKPCRAMEQMAERYGQDGHSHSWLTLAEIKAYDIDQEVDDGALIVGRHQDGSVAATAQWASGGPHERVGRRKVLRWPGADEPTSWLRLIRYMEYAKWDGQSDEEVRLVFFFDN